MMLDDIVQKILEIGGDATVAEELDMPGPVLRLPAGELRAAAEFLHAQEFDSLMSLAGIDYAGMKTHGAEAGDSLGVVYHFFSFTHRLKVTLKVWLPRTEPTVATISDLWRTAEWHEREAFDLYGIQFEGHPRLTRILLPEDWVGWPLRKDYEMPVEYRGIRHRDPVEVPVEEAAS